MKTVNVRPEYMFMFLRLYDLKQSIENELKDFKNLDKKTKTNLLKKFHIIFNELNRLQAK